MKNKFSQRLQESRNNKQFSQKEFSELLFVNQNTVSMWESGKREPSFDMLLAICEILEVTTDYLLGRVEF